MTKTFFLTIVGATSLVFNASLQEPPKWSANINMVHEDRVSAHGDSLRGRSYGSAEWIVGETPGSSIVNLTFTNSGEARELSWAILFGRCRSATLPVLPISTFPELDMTGGGAVNVTAVLLTELPRSGQYHINVYSDRAGGEESVIACGDLRYSERG